MSKGTELYVYAGRGFTINIERRKSGNWQDKMSYSGSQTLSRDSFELEWRIPLVGSENDRLWVQVKDTNGAVIKELRVTATAPSDQFSDEERSHWMAPMEITDDYCLSYAMYYKHDSFLGSLNPIVAAAKWYASTNEVITKCQLHVIITRNQRNWMDRLFTQLESEGKSLSVLKLNNLTLPGSHDSGMFKNILPAAVAMFANTQKNNTTAQLLAGARAFDFRAGYISEPVISLDILDEIYHLHAAIPGERYQTFLKDICDFLSKNRREIVTVYVSNDGILNKFRTDKGESRPLKALMGEQHSAQNTYPELVIGNEASLDKTISELMNRNERLIILYGDEKMPGAAIKRLQSWKSAFANSAKAENAIEALKVFNTATVNQDVKLFDIGLQITPSADVSSAISGAVNILNNAVIGVEHDNNLLLSTKAACDHLTYNWLRSGKLRTDVLDRLFTVTNDFYDPALTDIIYDVNVQRIKKLMKG